jgi:hypothetical protein
MGTSLASYYKTNHLLVTHHKYSISEIESMIPFERDVICDLIAADQRDEPSTTLEAPLD